MASVNKVILLGNLGKDPEVRYLPNGDVVANVSIATTEKFKDKNGEQQERTEWHRLVFYRRLAEIAGEYLKKGSSIYVEGRIQTRSWEADGEKKYSTEIIVSEMKMLGGPRDGSSAQPRGSSSQKPAGAQSGGASKFDDMDDDIPF